MHEPRVDSVSLLTSLSVRLSDEIPGLGQNGAHTNIDQTEFAVHLRVPEAT